MQWHPGFHAFIRRLYFSRITVSGADRLPDSGPVLALLLHRNGAVDAFVYRGVLREVVFMVKSTLRQSLMGRLFFDGIEVARSQDAGGSTRNIESINQCVAQLGGGGWLGVFPEGTSQLGPRHLPFKSGAARIASKHLESGRELTVLPLGIHYECAWAFRSRVEVVIGTPMRLLPQDARLQDLKARFAAALEEVGVNFPDAHGQDLAERFAYIATLGTGIGYFDALKAMEAGLPPRAVIAWGILESKAKGRCLLRHQGVPLFPLRMPWAYLMVTLLAAVPVIAGAIVNSPPVLVAWWAGRRFADDRNVIALWRILTGVPLFAIWTLSVFMAGLLSGYWWLPCCHLVLSALTVFGWYRLKKTAVVAWNGLFHADLREDALAVRGEIITFLTSNLQPLHKHEDPLVSTASPA